MRDSIPGVVLVMILAGCASAPSVAVTHTPGNYILESNHPVTSISTLSVTYAF